MVKEFIVPLEKQISNEQGEKQVPEKETQEIVGQKRRARTCTGTSSTSASKKMIAAGGTRRSKRVKVAHTRYVPVEEVSYYWPSSHYAFSGVVKMHPTLTASPPLDNISATDDIMVMDGSNEDVNTSSSRRVLAAAAAPRVNKRKKVTRHLMSASKISWRSKQSLDTAMCLKHSQEAMSTFLWENGAIISDSLTKLSKREEARVANFPKLT